MMTTKIPASSAARQLKFYKKAPKARAKGISFARAFILWNIYS